MKSSYQVLSRKWRPQTLKEVVGQPHIVRSLENILQQKKMAQAYLFTGTRGVGKTSVARILAKSLCCPHLVEKIHPCLECMVCTSIDQGNWMDVQEIDGASNNSVDNVRKIIDEAHYLPTQGRFKIIIIDEVHMLSHSAFNALLKILEEPPEHLVFILATTGPEKVLDTVQSRCQRFDFRHVSSGDLISHMKHIAENENISFEKEDFLEHIAGLGKGSIRDTLSLLDQVLALTPSGHISEEILLMSLGLPKEKSLQDIGKALIEGDVDQVSYLYDEFFKENVGLENLLVALQDTFFDLIQKKLKNDSDETLKAYPISELMWIYESLVKDFSWCLHSLSPLKVTKLVLQKVALRRTFFEVDQVVADHKKEEKQDQMTESIHHLGEEKKNPTKTPDSLINSVSHSHSTSEPAVSKKEEKVNKEEKRESKQEEKEEKIEQEDSIPSSPTSEDVSGPRTWDGFLAHVGKTNSLLMINLKHGNLQDELIFGETLKISWAIAEKGKVFYEYLQGKEVREKLMSELSTYFSYDPDNILLQLSLLAEKEKQRLGFYSKIEIEKDLETSKLKEKEEIFLKNDFILQAQKLFHSKIDKVIINEEKN